jgi:anti-sigma-K factor RskA
MNPQSEELACLYVLDQLDPRERSAFEERMLKDPALTELVRALESTLARRIHALPQHQPPDGLLRRIESRIGRLREEREPERRGPALWASVARWGIAAVIAASVGILAVQSLRRPAAGQPSIVFVGLDSAGSRVAELPASAAQQGSDARFIQLASLAEKYWDRPENLPVKIGGGRDEGRGYAVFDPGSSEGFIAIRHLATAAAGKNYHLWVVDTTNGSVREAGILPLGGTNRGLYFFSVAPTGGTNPEKLGFFVTAEDADKTGLARPQGAVVMGDRRI